MKCPRCGSKLRAEHDMFGNDMVCFCGHREAVGWQPSWQDLEGRGKVEMLPKFASKTRLSVRRRLATTAERHDDLMKHGRRKAAV